MSGGTPRAVVTGGAGFIGSHVVDALLTRGLRVSVIDDFSTGRPDNLRHVAGRVDLHEADIATPGPWQRVLDGADWVLHLAALADIGVTDFAAVEFGGNPDEIADTRAAVKELLG